MKSEDNWLIAAVFAIWGLLALMYATVPMILMPAAVRVWGFGALLFFALALTGWFATRMRRGGGRDPAAR